MHFAVLAFGIVFAMGVFIWLCLPVSFYRAIATGAFFTMTIGIFAAAVENTGQPKPLAFEWRNVLEAQIVGLAWDEGQEIVWVWAMHGNAPVAYSMPWPKDKKVMGALQDKWRRRGATGDEFTLSMEGDVAKVVPPKPQPEKQ